MEIKKINEDLINVEDIKMLINQKENKEYKIMYIDINTSMKNKYRMELMYSKKFKKLTDKYESELLELAERLYARFKSALKSKNIPSKLICTAVEVYIDSNSLGSYIVIDVPILKLISNDDVQTKDRLFVNYVTSRFSQISKDMTLDLHSFIDDYFVEFKKLPNIEEYEFIMYFDGKSLLYSDFVQTTDYEYTVEKYNIFKLANKEDLLEKLEDKVLKTMRYIPKKRYYKVRFNYKNNNIGSLTCCPLLCAKASV